MSAVQAPRNAGNARGSPGGPKPPGTGPPAGGGGVPLSALLSPMSLVYMLDYTWVILLYGTCAFFLAVLIDGHLLPAYDTARTAETPTLLLFAEVFTQIAWQGAVVILITSLLQTVPSPVQGLWGYDSHTAIGGVLRNPAILTVILFGLSISLQDRLAQLFSRFDKNKRQP